MKAMNMWSTLRRVGTSLAAAVVASIAIATPMMATGRDQQAAEQNIPPAPAAIDAAQAAEQAREAGLTPVEALVLQKRVDKVIAETGGTQIAANKVLWPDGSGATTIPLPGEKRARTLGETGTEALYCHDGEVGWFCFWPYPDYLGTRYEMYDCGYYVIQKYLFDDIPGSWENNQTRGTQAVFYDDFLREVARTPARYSRNPSSEVMAITGVIKPC